MIVIEIGDKLNTLLHHFMFVIFVMFGISRINKIDSYTNVFVRYFNEIYKRRKIRWKQ